MDISRCRKQVCLRRVPIFKVHFICFFCLTKTSILTIFFKLYRNENEARSYKSSQTKKNGLSCYKNNVVKDMKMFFDK